MEACKLCQASRLKDLTQGLGDKRHYFCPDCKSHYWDSRWWSRDEWDAYVDNVDFNNF